MLINFNRGGGRQNGRIEYIDLAKGFCIILVVMFHCDIYFFHQEYCVNTMIGNTFRMPLYYFLSGLFFKTYRGFFDFVLKKVNKLLIPFAFFYIFTGILLPFVLQECNINVGVKSVIGWHSFINFYYEKFTNIPLWFLLSLFETNIIFYFCLICVEKYVKYFKVIALCMLLFLIGISGFYLGRVNINLPMFIDTSMTVLPFFAIGYIFRKYSNILVKNKYDRLGLLFVLVLACITLCLSGGSTMFIENKFDINPLVFYIRGITGTLCVLYLSKAIVKLPFVSYIGRYSIMILLTHLLVLAVVSMVVSKLICNSDLAYWTTVCVTLISYIVIIPLMKKYLPYVTSQKDVFNL